MLFNASGWFFFPAVEVQDGGNDMATVGGKMREIVFQASRE